jgi:hypothetical protein
VKAIELPALNMPSNLEVYDTKNESKYLKTGEGYKEFEVLLIPRAAGKATVPAIAVSYFDPQQKKYVSKSTPAFALNVSPGDGSAAPAVGVPLADGESGKAKGEGSAAAAKLDIRFLKTSADLRLPPSAARVLWPLIFLVIFGFFGIRSWQILRGPVDDPIARARKRAKLKLKTARSKLKAQDWRGVGVEVSNAIVATLGEVAGVGGGSASSDVLLAKIFNGQKSAVAEKLQKFLVRCETLSFAPEEMIGDLKKPESLKSIIDEAERVIAELLAEAAKEHASRAASGPSAPITS